MSRADAPRLPEAALILAEAGYHKLLGYRPIEWVEGRSVVELDITPAHLNLSGVLHGGLLSALLDIVCAQAGCYCPTPGHMRKAVTLSLTTTFTGQCGSGTIKAVGTLKASGRRIYNSTGEIFDADGNLLAFGEATCQLRSGSEELVGVPIGGE